MRVLCLVVVVSLVCSEPVRFALVGWAGVPGLATPAFPEPNEPLLVAGFAPCSAVQLGRSEHASCPIDCMVAGGTVEHDDLWLSAMGGPCCWWAGCCGWSFWSLLGLSGMVVVDLESVAA